MKLLYSKSMVMLVVTRSSSVSIKLFGNRGPLLVLTLFNPETIPKKSMNRGKDRLLCNLRSILFTALLKLVSYPALAFVRRASPPLNRFLLMTDAPTCPKIVAGIATAEVLKLT